LPPPPRAQGGVGPHGGFRPSGARRGRPFGGADGGPEPLFGAQPGRSRAGAFAAAAGGPDGATFAPTRRGRRRPGRFPGRCGRGAPAGSVAATGAKANPPRKRPRFAGSRGQIQGRIRSRIQGRSPAKPRRRQKKARHGPGKSPFRAHAGRWAAQFGQKLGLPGRKSYTNPVATGYAARGSPAYALYK